MEIFEEIKASKLLGNKLSNTSALKINTLEKLVTLKLSRRLTTIALKF
jgi:hypothetical protein